MLQGVLAADKVAGELGDIFTEKCLYIFGSLSGISMLCTVPNIGRVNPDAAVIPKFANQLEEVPFSAS